LRDEALNSKAGVARSAIRRLLKGLLVTAVVAAAVIWLLSLFSLPVAALSVRELALVIGLASAGPLALTLASVVELVRGGRQLARLLTGLDLWIEPGCATGRFGGATVRAEPAGFEAPDGSRRSVWLLRSLPAGDFDTLVMRRGEPLPDYGAALGEAQGPRDDVVLRVARGMMAPPWLGEPAAAALLASPDFLQLRSGARSLRVILKQPLTDPLTLRRAFVLAGAHLARADLGGASERADVEPAAFGPGDLEGSRRHARGFVVGVVVLCAAMAALLWMIPDNEPYDDYIIEQARACPLASEALGAPIARQHLGFELSGQSNREVTSEIALEGSRARGRIHVEAYQRTRGSVTVPRSAVLEVGSERVEVLACATRWTVGAPAPLRFHGMVTRADGAPVHVSAPCNVEMTPAQGAYKCRLVITCAGYRLYGANDESGYSPCWTVDHGGAEVLVARDRQSAAEADGGAEPWLDLDMRTGLALMGDQRGAWSLTIDLRAP
jgi:hypothetical protein